MICNYSSVHIVAAGGISYPHIRVLSRVGRTNRHLQVALWLYMARGHTTSP